MRGISRQTQISRTRGDIPLPRLRFAKPPSPARGEGAPCTWRVFAYATNSRPRRAADVDHVAVAGGGVLVDEAGDQDPAVERDNLAVLLAGHRSGRADIVLAARGTLQPQFLRGGLVGQMHDDAAVLAGADHVRLLALAPRGILGALSVRRVLVRGEAPAADDFVGADGGRHFRTHGLVGLRR